MHILNISTDYQSERLRYLGHWIESRWINLKVVWTSDPGAQIHYTFERPDSAKWWIPAQTYLLEKADWPHVEFELLGEMPVLFKTGEEEFDIFSAWFWMLARVEEYHNKKTDKHGRLDLEAFASTKHHYHKIPLCDIWMVWFKRKLEAMGFVDLQLRKSKYNLQIGVDVDFAWKYANKPIHRQILGSLKNIFDLKPLELIERLKVLSGFKKDPYDVYSEIQSKKSSTTEILYFILAGGKSRFDRNHALNHPAMEILLKKISKDHQIGVHPSYRSLDKPELIYQEKNHLEHLGQIAVNKSRFHYLRFSLPQSYRQLLKAGITEDYSMGFVQDSGFRAGTAFSFLWYDLLAEQQTPLKIHPFVVMDRTYKDYLAVTPEIALLDFSNFKKLCEVYGASCGLIWHNSSMDFEGEWKGWDVFWNGIS